MHVKDILILEPFTALCNENIYSDIFLQYLKVAKVLPIYKRGNKAVIFLDTTFKLLTDILEAMERDELVRLTLIVS